MGKRILVVDDDPTSLKLLDLILNKEGYQVMTASNGLEALRKARLESPDFDPGCHVAWLRWFRDLPSLTNRTSHGNNAHYDALK
jgi:FixJ family two-component response regulator